MTARAHPRAPAGCAFSVVRKEAPSAALLGLTVSAMAAGVAARGAVQWQVIAPKVLRCASGMDERGPAIRGCYRNGLDAMLESVHVPSHSRHRHNEVTVRTFARVSMIFPLQNGHIAGRVTASFTRDSDMVVNSPPPAAINS
jgi:hypothetical protein